MRVWKRVLACALAVMLILPSVSAAAAEPQGNSQEQQEPGETPSGETPSGETPGGETPSGETPGDETPSGETPGGETPSGETPGGETPGEETQGGETPDGETQGGETPGEETQGGETLGGETPPANTALDVTEELTYDVIQFNTGDHVWSVADVDPDIFYSLEEPAGDVCFDEDGSYTINIPEANPFFPYEVQFTYNGEVTNEWFMSPDDSVEIGGHTFYVSAYFDGTALTQMSLKIGGDTVVVYPEEKEFTNDGSGVVPMSLIPLESKTLQTVDLSGYTPIELTMVEIGGIIQDGETNVTDSTMIAWKRADDSSDDYTLSKANDKVDLSYGCSDGDTTRWELIVGDGDQLNPNNIRYYVPIQTPSMEDWMIPLAYAEDAAGNRTEMSIQDFNCSEQYGRQEYHLETYTRGAMIVTRYLSTSFSGEELRNRDMYVSLNLQNEQFAESKISSIRVASDLCGRIEDLDWSLAEYEITDEIFSANMAQSQAGYNIDLIGSENLTLVAYNANNEIIGFMPMMWDMYSSSDAISVRLYDKSDSYPTSLGTNWVYGTNYSVGFEVADTSSVNGTYTLVISHEKYTGDDFPDITAVYVGQYASIAEATNAGAANIRDSVLGTISEVDGYEVNFSQGGIWFTVFAGADGDANQKRYSFCAYTTEAAPNSGTFFNIDGLYDADGREVPSHVIDSSDDSYAENNYITILVGEDTDLTKQYAPVFTLSSRAAAYTAGSSTPEVSGKSLHSFANGAVQYSVSAENGVNSKNYWVQVKKANTANGQLYISSLEDPDANTRVENGITYSTREMFLDAYHNYIHDICLVNIGTEALTNLSVELSSDVVELDEYWTLSGQQALQGMTTVSRPSYSSGQEGELPNLAKLRLRAKVGVESGTEVSGTLTIKSDGKTIMVLTLTGTIGDPCITMTEIPDAVKYVPYATMIQNSNKYSWIEPVYSLTNGELPDGMEIKPNGELYGVPRETGTFTFTVMAEFGSNREDYNFPSSSVTLTLNVQENTNANVYNASDAGAGYSLETPIGVEVTPGSYDFYLGEIVDSLFVSEGQYNEFIDLWLNGQKLLKGVDYTAESGSTRITISAQTLQNKAEQTGANTIAAEFRVGGDVNNELRRTAQNFRMDGATNSETGSSASSAGSSGGGGSNRSNVTGVTITGYLVDANNSPLVGMNVELHSTPRTTVTGTNGVFRFSDVEFGWHTLIVKDANGNTQASKRFELREDSVVTLSDNLITAPAGSGISFTVRLADGDLNFSNVRLLTAPPTGDAAAPEVWLFVLVMTGCAILAGAVIYRKKIKHS